MSKLAEILKIENAPRETPVQKRTVRLVKMGAFLRAYDWSAWLLKRSGSSLNAGLDRGDGSSHIFVGFPVSSADKFVPEDSETLKDGDGIMTTRQLTTLSSRLPKRNSGAPANVSLRPSLAPLRLSRLCFPMHRLSNVTVALRVSSMPACSAAATSNDTLSPR